MVNYYYDRGAGKTNLLFTAKRKAKHLIKWYFSDKFSFTLNIIFLVGGIL